MAGSLRDFEIAPANFVTFPLGNMSALTASFRTGVNMGWSLQTIGVRELIASNRVSGKPSSVFPLTRDYDQVGMAKNLKYFGVWYKA